MRQYKVKIVTGTTVHEEKTLSCAVTAADFTAAARKAEAIATRNGARVTAVTEIR